MADNTVTSKIPQMESKAKPPKTTGKDNNKKFIVGDSVYRKNPTYYISSCKEGNFRTPSL